MTSRPRRRSVDSSDSSVSECDSDYKKEAQDEQHDEQQLLEQDVYGSQPQIPEEVEQLPSYPPAIDRITFSSSSNHFPTAVLQTGPPPFDDIDGSPIYIGSALLDNSVHPCKIGPHLRPFAHVPYGNHELLHAGRFHLLPFREDVMEWVRTSGGLIPNGRRPIEGGYEENGEKLYHAAAFVKGVKVPGKTGIHLGGARISFGGREHRIVDDYEILCWR